MSAAESITYGALWLFPFYTELRFALVAAWPKSLVDIGGYIWNLVQESLPIAIHSPS